MASGSRGSQHAKAFFIAAEGLPMGEYHDFSLKSNPHGKCDNWVFIK